MPSEPKPQFNLPETPLPAERFLDHVEQNPGTSVHKLLEPFNARETVLRSVFAQDPNNEIVENNVVNLVDVFSNGNSDKVRIRGRNLEAETVQEQERRENFSSIWKKACRANLWLQIHYAIDS